MLLDIAAAVGAAKAGGKVGVVGYCLGGTLAWLAAAKVEGPRGGGRLLRRRRAGARRAEAARSGHAAFRREGRAHSARRRARFAAAHPDTPVFTYPSGGHAFNRYGNAAYDAPSATLARQRTMAFFASNLG